MTGPVAQHSRRRRTRGQELDTRARNWLMFLVALGLTIYEATVQSGERPFLLTLYASMMGLPLILGKGKTSTESEESDE